MEKRFSVKDIDRLLADAHNDMGNKMLQNPDALTEFKGMINLRDMLKRLP